MGMIVSEVSVPEGAPVPTTFATAEVLVKPQPKPGPMTPTYGMRTACQSNSIPK
jgi:hypothetical protein